MRAVLDTVVFVRALINPVSVWGQLLEAHDEYELVISPEILVEIVDVLNRPELLRRFPRMSALPDARRVLGIIEKAEFVEPADVEPVCRDPKDDKFFACAIAGGADYIVSEDRDILVVGEYRGVRTVHAAKFLALLGR
ncbi:MAG: putative toxin-antitoxin system toxin component, PIN family [Chloroflexi bacterium]|nr:putative toxin-antitoxin system toxin component, PIN family [Chloroflexota bacterium]